MTVASGSVLATRAGLAPPLAVPAQAYLLLEADGPDALEDLAAVAAEYPVAVAQAAADRARLWAYRERQPEAAGFLGVPLKLDVAVPAARWAEVMAPETKRSSSSCRP